MGLVNGALRLGISDTNNTIAQRLLQESSVVAVCSADFSVQFGVLLIYTILKYTRTQAWALSGTRNGGLEERFESASIFQYGRMRSSGNLLEATGRPY